MAEGMSSGEMVGLGLGVAVLVLGGGALLLSNKSDQSATLALQRMQLEAQRQQLQGGQRGGGGVGGVLGDVVKAAPGVIKLASSIKDLLG
jgi:hypothetical protein